jgi:hypothetical protein
VQKHFHWQLLARIADAIFDRDQTARHDVGYPSHMRRIAPVLVAALCPGLALADEGGGGASVWLPGQFASFAAVPGDPGFSLETIVYVRSAGAMAGTSFSRGGRLLAGLSVNEQYVYLTPPVRSSQPCRTAN